MAVINPSERKLAKRTSVQCAMVLPIGFLRVWVFGSFVFIREFVKGLLKVCDLLRALKDKNCNLFYFSPSDFVVT